jgi:hypothetical protein
MTSNIKLKIKSNVVETDKYRTSIHERIMQNLWHYFHNTWAEYDEFRKKSSPIKSIFPRIYLIFSSINCF